MFLRSLAAAFLGLALAACGEPTRSELIPVEGDAAMGPADAKVTLVEYGSPTCPGCKFWHDTYWEEVKRDYIAPGKIKFVFREFAIHGAIDVREQCRNLLPHPRKLCSVIRDFVLWHRNFKPGFDCHAAAGCALPVKVCWVDVQPANGGQCLLRCCYNAAEVDPL